MAVSAASLLSARAHIQNMSEAKFLEPHWGYVPRSKPCTNDAGSCEYLDIVYHSHDLGILYSGIFWASVGAILLLWAIGRQVLHSQPSGVRLPVQTGEGSTSQVGTLERLQRTILSFARRHLLPDAARPIFGRTTRTQVLTLVVLTGYLTVWTFVGIVYKKWITPVKASPGVYNTRTSLGPWSDRIGILAYALTPLSVMLSSRESILSLVTGLPYQSFNFLHRWLGYIIFAQSSLHTIGWCVVEMRLYQPQPTVAIEWIKQLYMIWGVVAMFILLLLVVLSTPWGIRLTGYEFFRKAHYVLAMLYIGACWGHWAQLSPFLLTSLIVWFVDRGVRLARTALLHYNYLPSGHMGFRSATANITFFPDPINGDAVRLDFDHPHDAWNIGQHFYLCFPESSIWQSHPFTPLSLPVIGTGHQRHSYIFRAKKGETKRIAELSARRALKTLADETAPLSDAKLSVVLNGPYGENIARDLAPEANVLCIAGGTGITYVLPVLLSLAAQPHSRDRQVSLVWVVRQKQDIDWVGPELAVLKSWVKTSGLTIRIFVTRAAQGATTQESESGLNPKDMEEKEMKTKEITASSSDSALSVHGLSKSELSLDHVHNRPHLDEVVSSFVEQNVRGRTDVFASGPGEMISQLRSIVAKHNEPSRVWRGEERGDVRLTCDDRLEW
ncbi:ferric-chelate reductase-like protein [Melanomma pulvis-pyrius CBS 109.77]|uniref:Ferric-chelate reductase-like protein n=1 Tax=Melanomma pulvis-pyrius CBS 109.77 TaxID=1314802 RepID=A0A6A6XQY6_9PLEO|nr:ferric-chelate reductase-like protein [Melanomma pulvis-pyrius CBS 109.77]